MGYEKLKSIGFLTGKAHNLIKARAQRYLDEKGIPLKMDEFPVLNTLFSRPGSTQQAIADQLGLDRHRVSRMVDELESKGWVRRTAHPDNRRENVLTLTPLAKKKQAEIDAALRLAIEDAFDGVAADKRRIVTEALLRIIQNLR